MNVVMFYHSLRSDWNHGNAHFLRGVVAELQQRGHAVRVYEPRDGWSLQNLTREHGDEPVRSFRRLFPRLWSTLYCEQSLDLDEVLRAADAGEMGRQMERVLTDADTARALAGHGLECIRSRHTCVQRVDELLAIYRGVSQ